MELIKDFEKYLLLSGISSSSIAGYQYDIQGFFEFLQQRYGERSIKDPETIVDFLRYDAHETDILAYYSYLENAVHNAPATIRRKLSSLNKFFGFLLQQKKIEHNLLSNIDLTRREYLPKAYLLPNELAEFVKYVETSESLRNQLICFLVLFCGCTVTELAELKLEHIHGNSVLIHKSGVLKRTIKINDALICVLSRFLNESNKVIRENLFYSQKGTALSVRMIKYVIHDALIHSGVYKTGMSANTLRNTCAYLCMNYKKYSLKKIQTFFGHKNITTTALLLDFDETYLGESVEKLHPIVEKYLF